MREIKASSLRASRSALFISAELPPFLASRIRFSLRERTRISSKFSIGPINGSCSQPTRSLLQLNLTTATSGSGAAREGVWGSVTKLVDKRKAKVTRIFIANPPLASGHHYDYQSNDQGLK